MELGSEPFEPAPSLSYRYIDRSTLFRNTNLIQHYRLISMRGVLANCYNFETNLLIHTNYYYINAIKYSLN